MPTTITVTDAHGKKVRAKVGDNVSILRRVEVKRKKNATVAKFPAPLIVNLERDGARVMARVQFHTEDKRPHVQSFAGTDLQLAVPMFKIGDSIEVVAAHPTVFVPVGCQGTVVGGDGATFHVTFAVHKLADGTVVEPYQTVSQTGVDGKALKFIKARPVEPPSESDSESSDSNSSSSSSSSHDGDDRGDECEGDECEGKGGDECEGDGDDRGEGEGGDECEGDECEGDGGDRGDKHRAAEHEAERKGHKPGSSRDNNDEKEEDIFTKYMSTAARSALLRHLHANTLLNFKDWFQTKCHHAHVRVDTLPQLQGVLIEFTRHCQPSFRLSPAHKIALRNLGATSADLLEIEHQPGLRGGGLEEFMKFFTDMKRR